MDFDIGGTHGGRLRFAALAMARGEYSVEVVQDGDMLAFVLLRGCLQITRQRTGQPAAYCLHATRTSPLVLINPGTYCVVAERSALGLRAMKRRAP